jgi:hypothetical protein
MREKQEGNSLMIYRARGNFNKLPVSSNKDYFLESRDIFNIIQQSRIGKLLKTNEKKKESESKKYSFRAGKSGLKGLNCKKN